MQDILYISLTLRQNIPNVISNGTLLELDTQHKGHSCNLKGVMFMSVFFIF